MINVLKEKAKVDDKWVEETRNQAKYLSINKFESEIKSIR